MRTRFMARHKDPGSAPRSKRQLRNRVKAIWQQEAQLLDKVLSEAAQGAVVVVPPLKTLLEKKLGKSLSLTTLHNMLHRHGWRKPAPDTAHPQGDPQAREDWKKTPQRPGTNTREFCQAASAAADVSGRSMLWAYQPMRTLSAGTSPRVSNFPPTSSCTFCRPTAPSSTRRNPCGMRYAKNIFTIRRLRIWTHSKRSSSRGFRPWKARMASLP